MKEHVNTDVASAKAIDGLLGFAQGVLTAREKVQMVMQSGLGVFPEDAVRGLPGVELDGDDGTWMRIARLRESVPPKAPDHVAAFMSTAGGDPSKPPSLVEAISLEVDIEEASALDELKIEPEAGDAHAPTPSDQGGVVQIGSIVRLRKKEDGGLMRIQIVERNHDPSRGIVGAHTPLGEALIDARIDEEIEYRSGPYLREVKVISIDEPGPL